MRRTLLATLLLAGILVYAQEPSAEANEDCLELVFGKYCLGGDISTLPPDPFGGGDVGPTPGSPVGTYVWGQATGELEVVSTYQGKVVAVQRALTSITAGGATMARLKYDELLATLTEKYGKGIPVSEGHEWRQPGGWTIALQINEAGVSLSYSHDDLWLAAKAVRLGEEAEAAAEVRRYPYIRVTRDGGNIRTGASTDSTIVAKAKAGDVFRLEEVSGEWFKISLFGGEYRYLHGSLAEKTSAAPPLPSSTEVRRKACVEIVKAQDRAVAEVAEYNARFPTENSTLTLVEYQLYDGYELPIFQKYGIAPARSGELAIECAEKRWFEEETKQTEARTSPVGLDAAPVARGTIFELIPPAFWFVWLFMAAIGGAIGQRRERSAAGFLWGLLLGPIGWLVILVAPRTDVKACPRCAEEIKAAASTCRYCGADV